MSQIEGSKMDINDKEVIDVEEYAKAGRKVPRHRRYRIRIDRERFVVCEPCLNGAEILALVDKTSQTHMLSQKFHGGQAKEVAPDEKVDFTRPGVERFMTLPFDTTEGSTSCDLARRDFELPENDRLFLEELGRPWETAIDGSNRWAIVHEWPICDGYSHAKISLAAIVQSGYPETQLDMIYVLPVLHRADGKAIGALAAQLICGERWQRWSRHRTAQNPWRVGVDDLASHLALADHWFAREFARRN